eukprot:Amastigsp_a6316_16.p5 type:complete len:101 gc:universal Amastigsp_a6316_16:170-472(+)
MCRWARIANATAPSAEHQARQLLGFGQPQNGPTTRNFQIAAAMTQRTVVEIAATVTCALESSVAAADAGRGGGGRWSFCSRRSTLASSAKARCCMRSSCV